MQVMKKGSSTILPAEGPLQVPMSTAFRAGKLTPGEYVVCTFEAENFEHLVMDVLYKAHQYLFGTWLPRHGITTEPFSAERYHSHSSDTTEMEIWVKTISS